MAATATASTVQYAPEDPTLPQPWKGLVDGKTGYVYYWNPETNVTQYERPASSPPAGPAPPRKSLNSSVHVQKASQGQRGDGGSNDNGDRYNRVENGGFTKLSYGAETYQSVRSGSHHPHDVPNGIVEDGAAKDGAGTGLSTDAYRRRHEITVTGDNVPPPLTSFDSTRFPNEILQEVRYLLQEELNVVHCGGLFLGLACYWSALSVNQICEGLSESSQFMAVTAVGYDSVYHWSEQKKGLLLPFLEAAYVAACNWGLMLLLALATRLSPERTIPRQHMWLPVRNAGFPAPTPIQAQSWPVALQGRDIVAIAKTGSGKTLGYLIPGFIHLKSKRNNPQLGPTVLVLSPTRELATQIQVEAIKFGKSSRISCTCLYGGAPKGPQLREVDRGVDVVVATPGRLNDILEMRRIRLDQVSYLVLDEADRMLDMGFEPQIRKIVKEVPTRRQTLMYTATWPKEVRKIAADLLLNPIQVNIGKVDELVANKSITQFVERVSPMEKHKRLEQILRSQEPGSKVIIFCTTKKMCDQLARNLSRQFGAAAIHGDKSQSDRDYVLNQFRSGRNLVLVATDVAARGLDIKDIRAVINYDFPTGIEDYVHRIGRTGRAGATGVAYTFFSDQDAKHASDLVKVLEGSNQKVPVEIRDMASLGGGIGRFKRPWGSGFGGRDNGRGGRGSDYNGRDGERNSWTSLSSERGGRGYDRNLQQSDRFVRRPHDVDGPGYGRNYTETITRPAEKRNRSRSRSPIRSLGKGSVWGDKRSRARSPSHSDDGLDKSTTSRDRPMRRMFHDHMIPQGCAPPPSSADSKSKHQDIPLGGLSSRLVDEEEEEGMISS